MMCERHAFHAPARVNASKRAFDLVFASIGLFALFPLFAAIALAIRWDSAGPVFFRQWRVGRGGAMFRIYKFRSMREEKDDAGPPLTVRRDGRVTRIGAILRRLKIDELPQLINVVKGEMSLVGPRPEIPSLMQLYSPQQREAILSMSPGMTDYAAILFRDESALLDGDEDPVETYRTRIMPRKFLLYRKYHEEMSFGADLRIIAATLCVLAFGGIPAMLDVDAEIDNARGAPCDN